MSWWNVSSCSSNSVVEWADGWAVLCPSGRQRKAWNSLFFAVIWSIWDARNRKVFKNEEMVISLATDAVKLKVAWWFKFFGQGTSNPITHILLDICERCVEPSKPRRVSLESWIPPGANALMFNVDGSARGNPGSASAGGVLRDSNGKIWCLFSLYVGSCSSNKAKLKAIEKAALLCSSDPRLHDREIVVASDSKIDVSWINDVGFGRLSHVGLVYDIRGYLGILRGTVVSFSLRTRNSFADNLAKLGSRSAGDFINWGDF